MPFTTAHVAFCVAFHLAFHLALPLQVISRMFKVTFGAGETVLEQDSLPTDDDCLYMLDTGEVDIVIAGSGEAANTNQEERQVLLTKQHRRAPADLLHLYHISTQSCTHFQQSLEAFISQQQNTVQLLLQLLLQALLL